MKNLAAVLFVAMLISPKICVGASQQRGFESLEAAESALYEVAREGRAEGLKEILGHEFVERAKSGDAFEDAFRLRQLAGRMAANTTFAAPDENSRVLEVGTEHWPLPVPLVRRAGLWYFDTETGLDEIIRRRIGENEIQAIKVARFYADAQRLYHSKDRTGKGPEYAQKFRSAAGQKDGLYWEESEAGETSPFQPVAEKMVEQGYKPGQQAGQGDPVYLGYRYRILKGQGPHAEEGERSYVGKDKRMTNGFALLAYPAKWGSSGIMSFVVNTTGVVFEKNLGPETQRAAKDIKLFDPDSSWKKVDE